MGFVAKVHLNNFGELWSTFPGSTNFLARSAKVAERAICFTDRDFYLFFFLFFNDFSETNYLKIRWTNFRNFYVE